MEVDTQGEEFRRLLGLLDTLSGEQRAQLKLQRVAGSGTGAVTANLEGRVAPRASCPRCGASRVVGNGHANGLQRYKCRACGRTFNALTGTALARLRQRENWLAQDNQG